MTAARKHDWRDTLAYVIRDDRHVSGKYGFELLDMKGDWTVFESDMDYSTHADAEHAAQDAALVAWVWRYAR